MEGLGTRTFGALLRRYRTDRELTQEELAERAGLSARGISDLERGVNRAPYQGTIERLIEALELSDREGTLLQTAGKRRRGPSSPASPRLIAVLPAPPTQLIGREWDEAAAVHLLRWEGRRLLTFTGAGGAGKTRLALQVAKTTATDFLSGAVFVDLASTSDPSRVPSAIAAVLGLREQRDVSLLESLVAYLRDREMLLLLDNFEQIVEAAPLVADLLAACPKLKILVTSRMPLRLRGEQEFEVSPLASLPSDGRHDVDALRRCPAVALFVYRARLVKPDFDLSVHNAVTVAKICQRVDGLPLAIELAAARVKLMSPQTLLVRLGGGDGGASLDTLTGGPRDLPERQQTVRNTIAWSYSLLNPEEQALLRRLSVFAGGGSLEAARMVCTVPDSDMDVLETASSLADQSLLRLEHEDEAEPRFRLLEIVREYGLQMLAIDPEANTLKLAHAEYYLRLTEEAEAELRGSDQAAWLARLEREHDNLRAALQWLLKRATDSDLALRLAGALANFWFVRGYLSEGMGWLNQVLESSEAHTRTRAKALCGAGILSEGQGEYERARSLVAEGLSIFREQGDTSGMAIALMHLGVFAQYQGDYEQAHRLNSESLDLFRAQGDMANVAQVLNNLGMVAQDHGEFKRAAELYGEALALSRNHGDTRQIAIVLLNLGLITAQQADYERATAMYQESLSLFKALGDTRVVAIVLLNLGEVAILQSEYQLASSFLRENLSLSADLGGKRNIAYSLETLGRLAAAQGRIDRAVRLWGAAETLRAANHMPLPPAIKAQFERDLSILRADYGETEWKAGWQAGRVMTLEQAIAYALDHA